MDPDQFARQPGMHKKISRWLFVAGLAVSVFFAFLLGVFAFASFRFSEPFLNEGVSVLIGLFFIACLITYIGSRAQYGKNKRIAGFVLLICGAGLTAALLFSTLRGDIGENLEGLYICLFGSLVCISAGYQMLFTTPTRNR